MHTVQGFSTPTTPCVNPTKPHVTPTTPCVNPTKPHVTPTTPCVNPTKPHVTPTTSRVTCACILPFPLSPVCVCIPFLACSGNESLAVPQSGALQTPSAASQHCPTTTAQDSRHQPVAPSSTSSQQTGRVFPPPQQSRPSSQCSGVQPPVPAASTLSQPVGNQLPRPAPPWMDTSSLGNDDFDDIDFNDFDDFDIPEEALQPAAQQPRPTPQSSLSCPSTVGGAPSLGNRPSLPSPAFTTEDWSALSQKSRPVCKVEPLQSKPPQTIVLDDSPPLARKLPQVDAKKGRVAALLLRTAGEEGSIWKVCGFGVFSYNFPCCSSEFAVYHDHIPV